MRLIQKHFAISCPLRRLDVDSGSFSKEPRDKVLALSLRKITASCILKMNLGALSDPREKVSQV